MADFLTLDDADFKGKTVLARVDINCPVDEKTGKISAGERIEGHAKTIRELAEKGAKVVVLAHQGRKGDYDYIPLKQHAEMLSGYVGKKVTYIPEVFGPKASAAIKAMNNGEVLLLENTRFFEGETVEKPPEEHAKGDMVRSLAPLADYFVLDAFSAAHRPHASVVGFAKVLPSFAGRVMQGEVSSIAKAIEKPKKPCVFIAGGAKPEDSIKIMTTLLDKEVMDKALMGGVLGNVMLVAKGHDLGVDMAFLKEKGHLELVPKAKALLEKYPGKIVVPIDVALELPEGRRVELDVNRLPAGYPIKDIGSKTSKDYEREIALAGTVIINGPLGVTEKKGFAAGTDAVLKAIALSNAFSIAGGGHTIASIDRLGLRGGFGYISLAGKAFMESLVGKKLIGVEMLKESAKKFKR
jgi:phosphoglycerate kinase